MTPIFNNPPSSSPSGQTIDSQQFAAMKTALATHQNYLADLLDTMEDAFTCMAIPSRQLIYASQSFEKVFGYPLTSYLSDPDFFKTVIHPDDLDATVAMREALSTKCCVEFEHRIIFPDGSLHWIYRRAWMNYDEHGNPININDMGRDITALKQTEAALHGAHTLLEQRVIERTTELEQTKNRFEAIFNTIADGVLLLDPISGIQAANRAFDTLLGVTADQYASITLDTWFPTDEASRLRRLMLDVARTRQPQHTEATVQRFDGSYFDAEMSVAPVEGSSDELATLVCIIRDVSTRKRTEAALRASEARYQTVVQTQTELICRYDTDLNLTFVNEAYSRRFGQSPDELLGRNFLTLIPETERDMVRSHAHQLLQTGGASVHEYEFHDPDGTPRWQYWTDISIEDDQGKITGVQAVGVDISQRKQVEIALKKKLDDEQELQQYLQSLHAITIELTKVEKLDDFYSAVVEMGLQHLGMDRMGFYLYDEERNLALGTYGTSDIGQVQAEDYIQFPIRQEGGMYSSLMKPERFHLAETADLYHAEGVVGTGWNLTIALWYGDRNLGWLVADNLIHQRPATSAQIEILAQYGIYVAASLARRHIEEALRASEEKFRLFVEAAPVATVITDLDGSVVLVNQAAEELFRYPRTELIGQQVETIVPIQHREQHSHVRTNYVRHMPQEKSNVMAITGRRKDGSVFPADIQLSHIDIKPAPFMMCHILDMTRRNQVEDALKQALIQEKELGELKSRFVSTTSHEFRTPLAGILAATESLTLYRDRMTETQIAERLERIRAQVLHMRNIMEDVLQLTKMQAGYTDFKLAPSDLDSLCRAIVDEFGSQPDYHGRLIYACSQPNINANFDARIMRQVISNLIHNGLKYSGKEKPVRVQLEQDTESITLNVSDEGIGIPPEDLKHLFEPFHRAANVGTISGTGLGLSIAKQAVSLHKGSLTAASQLGSGTTFTVRLPINWQV